CTYVKTSYRISSYKYFRVKTNLSSQENLLYITARKLFNNVVYTWSRNIKIFYNLFCKFTPFFSVNKNTLVSVVRFKHNIIYYTFSGNKSHSESVFRNKA